MFMTYRFFLHTSLNVFLAVVLNYHFVGVSIHMKFYVGIGGAHIDIESFYQFQYIAVTPNWRQP